jgi:HprK-related kinase A
MLHSAVIEREGQALILPALPGSGKSTLCAALTHRGWRLLSDEFGLIPPSSLSVYPLPRAIPLKNQSIEVIRRFAPEAVLGPVFPNTRKGAVSHMQPPGDSLERQQDPAKPRWIVFPRYIPDKTPELKPVRKSRAFTRLAHNSFNYRLLGATGFLTLGKLMRQCDCYAIEYGDLEGAIGALEQALFR